MLDLFALPWALFFLLTAQLHGLPQAPAIWLHSLSLFGGISVIPRVCFTWFSLQIVVLLLAGMVFNLYDPDGVRDALRRWLGIDPETLTGIVRRPIDQAIPTMVRDLPNKKEVDEIRRVIRDFPTKAEVYKIVCQAINEYQETAEVARPKEGEEGITVQVRE